MIGALGALAALIGMGMLLFALIPSVRRGRKHFVRNALGLVVVGFVITAIAPEPSGPTGQSPTNSTAQPRSSAPAAASEPATPLAGTPQEVDRWVIQAGSRDRSIVIRRSLGNEFLGTTADSGYTYALIPVYIKNNTTRTQSMGFPTWVLRDDGGYEYTIETLADLYLAERDRLDVTNIPPEATRFGYLVFQVRQAAASLTLEFGSGRNRRTWQFSDQ